MSSPESAWPGGGRIFEEAARAIAHSFSEVVPPEAQAHLIAAQRELLLAVVATVEHNSTRTVRSPRAKPRNKRPTKRPTKVSID